MIIAVADARDARLGRCCVAADAHDARLGRCGWW